MRDDYIKNKCSLDLEEWPPNQPKTVVNVALIHYKGSRTEQELIEISKRHKEGAPAVDKLAHHSRVTKDISIIFQTHVINSAESETKPPKLILIEGAPGIGKTVLARRIAYLWAKEELLANLNILFLLFLRDPELQSIKTAEELIQYLSKNDLDKEAVKNCVQQIKNLQVAIVMDGFDEYPIQLRKRSFIADIIRGRVFHNCTIVLTSRPTATIKLHSQADRRVEILGFAQEERDKYICESLDSPEQRKQIQDFLKCQPIINGLVYVPLHLAVLLYLFKVQSKLPETLTEMNELFILHTIYRSLTKDEIITEDEVTAINCMEDLPKNILGIVKGLSKLAFMGLENDQLVFSWDEISESCPQIKNNIPGAFNGFGLLQAVQHFPKAGQPGTTVSFNFLHFTMQEFLAALHVSDTSVIPYEQQLSLMEDKFWNSMFNFMWMMYVGINGVNSKAFMEFLYKVQPGTDIKQLELSNDIKSDKRKCLHLFQCFMETKSKEIPKEISSIFCNNEMNFHGLQLLPHHISSLTLYLSKYSMQLETLNLRDCHIGDVGMSILEHYFTTNPNKALTIKHIDLFGNDSLLLQNVYCAIFSRQNLIKLNWSSLGKVNIEEIIAVMNYNNVAVQSLNLSDNDFNDDDAERIAGVLVNNNTLKELNFSRNKITTKGAVAISDCVQKNVKLQHLIISWNNHSINTDHQTIDFSRRSANDTDVQIVTNILCKNETVTKLDLSHNRISDKGAKSICMCIESNKSLKEIDISGNKFSTAGLEKILDAVQINLTIQKFSISHYKISDDRVLAISEYLKNNSTLQELNISHIKISSGMISKTLQMNTALQIFDISHYNITAEGAIAISECLKNNNTLQKLYISYNQVSDNSIIIISKALQTNTMLQVLVISHNKITDEGAVAISECLKNNNTLQEFDISYNEVSDNGIAKISKALQINTTLQILLISHNNICDDRVVAIGKTLQSHYKDYSIVTTNKEIINEDHIKNSALQKLNMSCNKISSIGIVALCNYLKCNVTLQELKISWDDCETPIVLDSTSKVCNMSNLYFRDVGATLVSAFLFTKVEIQILNVSHNAISDDGAVAISEYLNNNNTLQLLNMSHNQVSGIGAINISKALQKNSSLQVLVISHNIISDDGAIAIGKILGNNYKDNSMVNEDSIQNSTLQKLDMSHNNISSKGIVALSDYFKSNVTLQKLAISWVDYKTPIVLDGTRKICSMSNLNFRDVGATLISAFLFKKVETRILDISHNAISDDGAVAISEYLRHNRTLLELNISHNEITSEGIAEILKSIHSDSSLHTLNLTHNIVTKSGFKIIHDMYKKCSNMPSMQISYNEIIDNYQNVDTILVSFENDRKEKFTTTNVKLEMYNRRASYKAKVLFFCAIEDDFVKELDLSSHGITNKEAKIIATALHGNKSLQKLDISNNNISDDGAIAIGKILNNYKDSSVVNEDSIQNSTLQKLNMSHNNISSNGIVALCDCLKSNVTLQELTISWDDCKTPIVLDSTSKVCNMSNLYFRDVGATLVSAFLFKKVETRILDISHNTISDDGAVAISEYLNNNNTLQLLNMSHNQVSGIGAINISKALQKNSSLQVLVISHNIISDDGAIAIGKILINNYKDSSMVNEDSIQNSTLQKLDMSHNNISSKGIVALSDYFKSNVTLQKLAISWVDYKTPIVLDGTRKICSMSNLNFRDVGATLISAFLFKKVETRILDISHNAISDDGAVAISEYFKYNGMLQELNISHNEITSEGIVEILKSIRSDSPLHILNLTHNIVTKPGLMMIYDIYKKCTNVPSMQISYNEIADISQKIDTFLVSFENNHKISFDQLKTTKVDFNGSASYRAQVLCFCATENEFIKELDISRHGITNKVTKTIAKALQGNVSLQELDISNNKISDDGTVAISEWFKNNNTLQKLDISYNQVFNIGINEIAKALQIQRTLQMLNISHNNISDDGVIAISECLKANTTIKELDISNNKITNDGITKIAEAIKANTTLSLLDVSKNNMDRSTKVATVFSDHLKHNNILHVLGISWNGSDTTYVFHVGINKECYVDTSWPKFKRSLASVNWDRYYYKPEFNYIEAILLIALVYGNVDIKIIKIVGKKISNSAAFVFSDFLKVNNTIETLKLSNSTINTEAIKQTIRAFQANTTLQMLDISSNNISDDVVVAISECLKANATLKELDISNNKITNDGIIKIAEAIKTNTTLSLLDVSENNMDRSIEVAIALSDHLKHNNTLQVLGISWNDSDTTYVYHVGINYECYVDTSWPNFKRSLASVNWDRYYYKPEFNYIEAILLIALVYGNVDIKIIKIVGKKISNSAAFVFSDFLKVNNTIETLKLSNSTINTEAIKQTIRAFQANTTLQMLDISSNNISDDVVVAISECLKANATLKELDISNNKITNDGIIKIAEAIKTNTTLSLLDVSENNMDRSIEVAIALSDHLKHNNTLQVLGISWNDSDTIYVYHVGINYECYVDTSWPKFKWSLASVNWNRFYYDELAFNDIEAILLTALVYGNVDVKKIKIVNNKISDSAALVISDFLKANKIIETLKLSNNTTSTEATKEIIKAIQTNTTLQILDVSSNNILCDDEGLAICISECLTKNNTLRKLSLSLNRITTKGITKIAEAIAVNTGLHTLDLSSQYIKDDWAMLACYLTTSQSILIDNDDAVMILLNVMDHNYTMMRLVVPMTVKKNEAVIKRKLDQINKERTKRSIKPLKLQNAAAN